MVNIDNWIHSSEHNFFTKYYPTFDSMNTKQYIQHERKWLSKAMHLMLNEKVVKELNPVEQLRYRELIERVIEGELDFLIEAPKEYQELYGGNELRVIK